MSIEELMQIEVPVAPTISGGHTHEKGEWMPMFHAMFMGMDGLRDGTDSLSTSEVLGDFMVAPTAMSMDMYVLGVMYGWSDSLTLMAMVPYHRKSMDHRTLATEFTTRTEGVGDFELTALYRLWNRGSDRVHFNTGLSIPTGSIDERGATPMGADSKLAYVMQLGSGTYDLKPAVTYTGENERWGWGAQAIATIRMGENSNDYTLGDRYALTGWAERKWTEEFSTSARLLGQTWMNIEGSDPELNPMMSPAADPDRQAGERLDLALGFDVHQRVDHMPWNGLFFEFGVPLLENLDGPQMSTAWWVRLGWSIRF